MRQRTNIRVGARGVALAGCILLSLFCAAQKQNNQWRFGMQASADFNGTRAVPGPPSKIESLTSTLSVADRNTGTLLFYSDGVTIWNAQDQVMPNGTGMRGTRTPPAQTVPANAPVLQGGQIVPRPGHPFEYYVFLLGGSPRGISWSRIDMRLHGGLGDVVASEKNVPLMAATSSYIQAVPTCDRQGYWVLAFAPTSNKLYAYLVTESGVDPTPVISDFPLLQRGGGVMKISPDYTRLALCFGFESASLGYFDNRLGRVNPDSIIVFPLPPDLPPQGPKSGDRPKGVLGLEFSPNGKLLYIANMQQIVQYDLMLPTDLQVANSGISMPPLRFPMAVYGLPQRAADGRIYEGAFVHGIMNPNIRGLGCGYMARPPFSSYGGYALPNWVYDNSEGKILVQDTCALSASSFLITDSMQVTEVLWDFGDPASGAANNGTGIRTTHNYSQPGTYTVSATINRSCGASQVLLRTITALDCCALPNSPYAAFDYGSGVVCDIQGEVQPKLASGFVAGGTFSSSPALVLNNATGVIDAASSAAGTYTVRYQVNPSICPNPVQAQAVIAIKAAPPAPVVVSPVELCQWAPRPVLSATGDNLRWYDDASDTTATAFAPRVDSSLPGSFEVYVVQQRDGCRSLPATIRVSVWEEPQVYAGGPERQIIVGDRITLEGTVSAGATYQWRPLPFNTLRPEVAPLVTTTYTLTATEAHGCTLSDSVKVIVSFILKVPNVFTPNGDGVNDTWIVNYLDTYPDLKFEVFTRWGQPVWRWQEKKQFWDGTFNGELLPGGTYYWVITPGHGFPVQKGFVDLIR